MSGQDGITSGTSKDQALSSQGNQQQQQQQQQPQQPEQQQAHIEWLQQQQQLALQIVQGGQAAPTAAAVAAAADTASPKSDVLQRKLRHSNVSLNSPRSAGSQLHASSRHSASCNDSSQSLTALMQEGRGDLSKLPPEVAAAAAAALPAAAAAASAVQSVHADSTASSRQHGRGDGAGSNSSSDGGEAAAHKPVLVGWELRLVMEFCDAVSYMRAYVHFTLLHA
jgi:uncharacterized membrane protein YgcG